MFPTQAVYLKDSHLITLLSDAEAPNARKVLRAFRDAVGEHHSDIEALYPPYRWAVHLHPGGALEVAR
jgi:hypothetical protein